MTGSIGSACVQEGPADHTTLPTLATHEGRYACKHAMPSYATCWLVAQQRTSSTAGQGRDSPKVLS